jgi:hypothetical protein
MKSDVSWERWWPRAVALAAVGAFAAQGTAPDFGQYRVAAYASDGFDVNSRLIVFPSDRREFKIPLPLTLRYVAYGASGQALYATAFKRLDAKSFTSLPGLLKIDLDPVRVTALPGFDVFDGIDRFAVSRQEEKIIFAGSRSDTGIRTCGIFELNLPDGGLRPVIQTTDCKAGYPGRVFDLSPDGREALISANRRLALLDLTDGKVTPIGSELWVGSYSPDGKWIAALELGPPGRSRTILIDRKDFSRRRDLGGSNDDEVVWSPDSRFILHAVYRPACPSQSALALETLDIETGKRFTLKESICNAGSSRDIGWVSSKIER